MTRRAAMACAVAALFIACGGYAQDDRGQAQAGVGRIRGTALHPDGTPAVSLEIEPVDAGNRPAVVRVSNVDGSFVTESLPAGRYRVGVDLGINRQPDEAYGRTYYPGTPDVSKAEVIQIAQGLPEPRIQFTIPMRRPFVRLRGAVTFEGGVPAPGVDVYFSPVGGYSAAQLWTDSKGSFERTNYGAVAYRIQSRSRDARFESTPIVVEAPDLEKPILLILREVKR